MSAECRVTAAPASEKDCAEVEGAGMMNGGARLDGEGVGAGLGTGPAADAVLAELEALRAENRELSIRVLELQEAAVIDEADMESAVAEMEAVIEDMADKLGAAEAQLETERREFSTRLQMLALESADQELMRREMMEGFQEKQNAAVHPMPEGAPGEREDASSVGGLKDTAAETHRLKQRVAELEAELQTLRLARKQTSQSAVKEEFNKHTNPFLSDKADFGGSTAKDVEHANGDAASVPLSRTVTPRTAHLRSVLGRTMNELKERRAERARAAAERAAERLVLQSAATASNGDYHFSDLTASAALTALSPDKKFVRPDDKKVVGMLERAERRRSMSGSDPPMRKWADQPVDVIRNELIRRGIREHQGVYDKSALLALLQH